MGISCVNYLKRIFNESFKKYFLSTFYASKASIKAFDRVGDFFVPSFSGNADGEKGNLSLWINFSSATTTIRVIFAFIVLCSCT